MYLELIEILRCPHCAGSLSMEQIITEDDEVTEGHLRCNCGKYFGILQGVLDFGSEEQQEGSRWSEELDQRSLDELNQDIRKTTPDNQLKLQDKAGQLIADYIQQHKPKLILDLATGRGMLLGKIASVLDSNLQMVCVDLSLPMLKAIREKHKKANPDLKINYVACDAGNLPFKNDCYDLAVSLGIGNMGASLMQGLKGVRRVLKEECLFLNTSIVVKAESKSYELLHAYYGERAGNLLKFILSSGFQELHEEAGFTDVQLQFVGDSFAQKNQGDLIPVEGDWFAFMIAFAR